MSRERIPSRFRALSVLLAVFGIVGACSECRKDDVRPRALGPRDDTPGALSAHPTHSIEADTPARLVVRTRLAMGTEFSVTTVGIAEARAVPVIERALDAVVQLEPLISEWIPTSVVSRINASAGREPVVADEDTLTLVQAGLAISRASQGAFDLSWAALRPFYLFTPGSHAAPDLARVREVLPLVDYRNIVVDTARRTVFLRRTGMAIGTGGIGKGLALDKAAEVLRQAGVDHFMLYAGGQVQVRGMRGNRPWRTGILHPRAQDYFAFLEVSSGSVSTSGDYEHMFVDAAGRRWHHIIDTKTGLPAEGVLSVTILAERGIDADALSTACFVLGPTRCVSMLAGFPGSPEAVIVTSDLHVVTTQALGSRLLFMTPLDASGVLPH